MLENALLITAAILTALLAGVFFGYAVSVNWGLGKLKDAEYVRAMQSINIVIQNGWFFLVFMGPIVLLPLVTFLFRASPVQFALLLIASIVYIVGSFILTIAGNVPLNNTLALADAGKDVAVARSQFEKPWNRLHTVRTLASIIAAALTVTACAIG